MAAISGDDGEIVNLLQVVLCLTTNEQKPRTLAPIMTDARCHEELEVPGTTTQEPLTPGSNRAIVLAPLHSAMTDTQQLSSQSNLTTGPTAPLVRPLNNRLITSDATAQAFAAAMNESSRAQAQRIQQRNTLLRRHSAREDTNAMSSHDDTNASYSTSTRTFVEASNSSLQRSMDAEEGVQHLRAKATAVLRDKILANRAGLRRMALTSGAAPTSFFSAAVLAVAAANDTSDKLADRDRDEPIQGEQYEELMARFQLRRLQRSMSQFSSAEDSVISQQNRSARVVPISTPGENEESEVNANNPAANDAGRGTCNGTAAPLHREDSSYFVAPSASFRHTPHTFRETNAALSMHEPGLMSVRGLDSHELADSEMSRVQSFWWKVEHWYRQTRRFRRKVAHRFLAPMSPYSWAFAVRSAIVIVACSFVIAFYPYQIAFLSFHDPTFRIFEIFFLLDFVLTFNTSILDKHGALISSRSEIAWHYFGGWGVPHFIANFPFSSVLSLGSHHDNLAFRWVHFAHAMYDCSIRMQQVVHILELYNRVGKLHVSRSSKSIWGWLLYSRYSHLLRLSWLLVAILLIAHYLACIWKMLQASSPALSSDHSNFHDYSACFYGAMQLLQGQGLGADTLAQNVFSSFAVLTGSVVLAIIYGHVTMLVSNFNANSTSYQRKMEVVFAIMDKMALPAALRERIHQYYQHLWREYESLDGEIVKFSKDLTHNLALEVSLFKYMALAMHVPFWGGCSPDFQKQLVLSLNVRVYLPDDFIMRRGEVSDEFYMINQGVCEIIRGKDSFEHCTAPLRSRKRRSMNVDPRLLAGLMSAQSRNSSRLEARRHSDVVAPTYKPDNETTSGSCMIDGTRSHAQLVPGTLTASAQLTRGQSFGEAALLLNYPRTANVRAVTYVEMCVLGRDAFQTMLTRHPDDRKHVLVQILTWLMGNNEYHRVTCPLKQSVCNVFGDTDPVTAAKIDAVAAAELLASTIDPHAEDGPLLRFGIVTNFQEKLQTLRKNDLASRDQVKTGKLIEPSISSPRFPCSCVSTPSISESEGVASYTSTQNQSANSKMDIEGLGNTINLQKQTLQIVQKLKSSITINTLPQQKKIESRPSRNDPDSKYQRRLSLTRKRSIPSPLIVDQAAIHEDGTSSTSGGLDHDDHSRPSTSRRDVGNKVSRPRLEPLPPTRGPLLRQMTSLIGFSRSGPTSFIETESPTRLADQLFQRNEPALQERRRFKRYDTVHDFMRREDN